MGRSVEVLGEGGAIGDLSCLGLRHNVKQSPVESYSIEGRVNMETSRQGRWRNSTQVGEWTGRLGGSRQESCENGIRRSGEGRTLRSEGSRMFNLVKIPNPLRAILASSRRLSVENGDIVLSFLMCLVLMKRQSRVFGVAEWQVLQKLCSVAVCILKSLLLRDLERGVTIEGIHIRILADFVPENIQYGLLNKYYARRQRQH